MKKMDNAFSISRESAAYLLKLARETIEQGTRGCAVDCGKPINDELAENAAVFVTLHKHGRLRGCIGTTMPALPLQEAVCEYAFAAAFRDPRFEGVAEKELKDINIEISVLSPMRRISSWKEIIPGQHGVVVSRGGRSGLFLPQVWEQLPELDSFMGYLCAEKAGIDYDAWKNDDTQISIFTVFAFEEGEK